MADDVQDTAAIGLTSAQAARRLAEDGPNAIADIAQHPIRRALGKFWAPIPWLLEAAIVLQLILGDDIEAAAVAVLLVANSALAFFQESRAQATLDALKSRLAVNAAVRRDGAWKIIPVAGLVRGDVVKLSLGAVVPADLRLIAGNVLIDQSMLTGESIPIEAEAGFEAGAGALVRRGEAVGQVTATGPRTKFGSSADLIRTAHVRSTEQTAIFRVVRNLGLFNGCITLLLIATAMWLDMSIADMIPLVLVALLATIPVALPSMFTLAATVGARAVARNGVLPTRLSALDEAAGVDVLCADKTGTLTRNELAVTECQALPGFTTPLVLAMASLASSEGGADPLDAAIRAATQPADLAGWQLATFTPFDPMRKMAEATATDATGTWLRIVKGALAAVAARAAPSPEAETGVAALQAMGYRVLVVACGPPGALRIAGMIALSDPPREDSAPLIAALRNLGVRTLMVTGDAAVTARVVADAVGITGPICAASPRPAVLDAAKFDVFAGVLPAEKFALVQALQRGGHVVAMCGDGANDAPALRQAQMGIAVSTATDVAKSAAGMVLTEPGLGGIVAAITEGRRTFQRILTYTLRSITHKIGQVLLLLAGLVLTGSAVLTPLLMVLMMVAGDFSALSSSTDNVVPSDRPNIWRIGNLTIVGLVLGVCDLAYCIAWVAIGSHFLRLNAEALRTLTVITKVSSGQAIFYVSRERRRLWASRPGPWLIVTSLLDLTLFATLATQGILMSALPAAVVATVLSAAILLALGLDTVKLLLFRRFPIT